MAHLYIVEENNPWWLDAQHLEPARSLLIKLEANPFVTFGCMKLNSELSGRGSGEVLLKKYNRAEALASLIEHEEGSVELLTASETNSLPLKVKVSVSRGEWRNTLMLATANKNLAVLGHDKLISYLLEASALFPKFGFAEIQTDGEIAEFYDESDLNFVPPCFGDFLSWYHLISPAAYQPYLSREELLALPAYQVREITPGGNIEIMTYEDPLTYNSPQTRTKIVKLTHYLNSHRLDWKKRSSPPALLDFAS